MHSLYQPLLLPPLAELVVPKLSPLYGNCVVCICCLLHMCLMNIIIFSKHILSEHAKLKATAKNARHQKPFLVP